jgi:predicted Ser/Thr protein kinase
VASTGSDAPTQAGSIGSGASTLGGPPDATPPRVSPYSGDLDPRAHTFSPGQIVGGCFRIERVLGAGGMGVVYEATHLSLDRVVALKVHRGATAADQGRLEAEARAMARLSHPNVVGVYDVRAAPEGLFIAMEFIDGVHARAWLAARKRPLTERLQACLHAGEGLAAAHAAGLVHRDFKPENVLVSRTGRVAVADFGLAGAPGKAGEIVGTPAYMAPEQFAGAAVDARADQFAFCVLLHEALYGVRPFAGRTPAELAYAVAHGEPVAPPRSTDVPEELRAVILRGLKPDPAQRHPTMGALLGEVRAVMRAPAKRAVGVAVVLALALAVIVGTTGFLTWRWVTEARARAVAMPQLQGLQLGEDASAASLEISAELIAHQRALVLEAERKTRAAAALQEIAEGDMFEDPEGLAAAIAQAGDDDAPIGGLVLGILKGVESSQARRDQQEYHRPAWDGRSTLVCGMNQMMEVVGVTARVESGPAIDAQMNCRIRLIDCDIEAETIVAGSMARIIYMEGGRYVAEKHLVQTDLAKEVIITGVKLDEPTGEAAVVIGMRSKATITGSTLRGSTALAVGMHAEVTVENSTLEGSEHAVAAEMHSRVTLKGTRLEGGIERGQNAVVEVVGE